MAHILIVEDDALIAEMIRQHLMSWGYAVTVNEDFANVLSTFHTIQPQLVLMDLSLPYYNGYYWLQKIRETSGTPVIFLSSRSEQMDMIMAVNMGADDYITKPVSMELLTAKIQAMLRRAYDYETKTPWTFRGAIFDPIAMCLTVGETKLRFSRNESCIFQTLLSAQGEVVSREKLMLALWDSDDFVDENTLTVNVNRLRKTLEEAGLPDAVITHKGKGYALHA